MACVFIDVGQDVHIDGSVEDAINEGVRQGYADGYLRKSVVRDPLDRVNTGDNTPAMIYYEIVPGDQIRITVAPKGFGSENMSQIKMLKPSDGVEGFKDYVVKVVEEAGPTPARRLWWAWASAARLTKPRCLPKRHCCAPLTSITPLLSMQRSKTNCFSASISWASVRRASAAGPRRWQSVFSPALPISQVCPWRSTSTATLPAISPR